MAASGNQDEKPTAEEALSRFMSSIGHESVRGVKVWTVDKVTRDRTYVGLREAIGGDLDAMLDLLRLDYPKGAEFYMTAIDKAGKPLDNFSMTVDALPARLQPKPETSTASTRSAPGMDPYMQMMFERQDRERQDAKEFNRTIVSGLIAVATAAVPAMFKGGSKGDSPVEILTAMMDLQKKLEPPKQEASDLERTLDLLGKAKALLPEAGAPAETGLLGQLVQALAPTLATMVAAQAAQQPQPQPVQVVPPGLPQPVAQANAVQVAPVQTVPMGSDLEQQAGDPMAHLMARLQPLLAAVKTLLDKGNDADSLFNFIDLQVASGQVDQDDVNFLLDKCEENPEFVPIILAQFGITNAEHVAIVQETIGLFSEGMDAEPEAGGIAGHAPGAGPDGAVRSGGIAHAGGTA